MAVVLTAFSFVAAQWFLSPFGELATWSAMAVFGLVFARLIVGGIR